VGQEQQLNVALLKTGLERSQLWGDRIAESALEIPVHQQNPAAANVLQRHDIAFKPGFPIWTRCSSGSYASPAIDTTRFVIKARHSQDRGFPRFVLPV
jgi:hypothetical protein